MCYACRAKGGSLTDAGSIPAASTKKLKRPPTWVAFLVFGGAGIEPERSEGSIDAQGRANAAGGRMPGAAKPPPSLSAANLCELTKLAAAKINKCCDQCNYG